MRFGIPRQHKQFLLIHSWSKASRVLHKLMKTFKPSQKNTGSFYVQRIQNQESEKYLNSICKLTITLHIGQRCVPGGGGHSQVKVHRYVPLIKVYFSSSKSMTGCQFPAFF